MLLLEVPRYKRIEAITNTSPEYISFSQGTVKVAGTPQKIKDHIKEKLQTEEMDYYQYVGGILPLRDKIAEHLSIKYGCRFSTENVMVSHGAIGGITALCLTLLNSGDEVLLPEPTYPSYRNIILFSKALPIFVEAFIQMENHWIFDVNRIRAAITSKTKMIVLSNPCNPCGVCLQKEEIQALVNLCVEKNIYLVFDEVYDNFIFSGTFHSGSPYVLLSEKVIRTGSFSKDFAMSGWRVGYVLADKTIIPRLMAVQDGTLCCPNVIGQYAALYALEHTDLIHEQISIVKKNREIACEFLKPLVENEKLFFLKPEAGIFLFIKIFTEDSEEFVMNLLQQAKVALVPGKDFGNAPRTHSYVRLCYARKEEILREGLKRIIDHLKKA